VTRFTLLGVPIDPLTEGEAVDWVARAIVEGHPRLVISVNPERIMHAGRDLAFGAVLRSADLALADGVGVVWAARRLGRPLPERVVGVDFVKALAARGAALGWRFFFLGGGPGVAEAAGRALREAYPGFHPGRDTRRLPRPRERRRHHRGGPLQRRPAALFGLRGWCRGGLARPEPGLPAGCGIGGWSGCTA
jgi:hypothetical protein